MIIGRITATTILLVLSLTLPAEMPPVPVPPENPITEEFPFDRPKLRSELVSAASASGATTGAWFDPNHDGEGWLIEVLAENRALVTWYSYDQEGKQMWLIGVGEISGSIIQIDELQVTHGTVFGTNFHSEDVILNIWGSLEIEFIDCNSATFTYQSITGFGSGALNAIRLTNLSGLECAP